MVGVSSCAAARWKGRTDRPEFLWRWCLRVGKRRRTDGGRFHQEHHDHHHCRVCVDISRRERTIEWRFLCSLRTEWAADCGCHRRMCTLVCRVGRLYLWKWWWQWCRPPLSSSSCQVSFWFNGLNIQPYSSKFNALLKSLLLFILRRFILTWKNIDLISISTKWILVEGSHNASRCIFIIGCNILKKQCCIVGAFRVDVGYNNTVQFTCYRISISSDQKFWRANNRLQYI